MFRRRCTGMNGLGTGSNSTRRMIKMGRYKVSFKGNKGLNRDEFYNMLSWMTWVDEDTLTVEKIEE